MANLSKVKFQGTTYELKDTFTRDKLPVRIIINSSTDNNDNTILTASHSASEINSIVSTTKQFLYLFIPTYGLTIQATFLYYQNNMAFFSFIASDGVFIISIGENKNVNIIRSYAFPNDISDLNDDIGIATLTDLADKYDKTGGEISGNVKVDGTLTLDIDDPDYDSGITFSKSLREITAPVGL